MATGRRNPIRPKGKMSAPKRDAAPPNPPLGDGPIMAIGIPAFGVAIPFLTGLYGTLTPSDIAFWAGALHSWRWRRRSGSAIAGCCCSSAAISTGSSSRRGS